MLTDWKQLSGFLNIDEHSIHESDVSALMVWCRNNVSEEIHFEGGADAVYSQLKTFLSPYFDKISASPDSDILKWLPGLNNMNCVQYTAMRGYDKYLQRILYANPEVRAGINLPSASGMTALHLAVLGGHEKTAALLLDCGADPGLKSCLGHTAMHSAVICLPNTSEEDKVKKARIFEWLRQKDPSLVGVCDVSGNTVVHFMAIHGFDALLERMAHSDESALLAKPDFFGKTPLNKAILNQHVRSVQILAQDPARLLIPDNDGRLPLHYAANQNSSIMFKACVPPGRDLTHKDHYGLDVRAIAQKNGNIEIIACLDDEPPGCSR